VQQRTGRYSCRGGDEVGFFLYPVRWVGASEIIRGSAGNRLFFIYI